MTTTAMLPADFAVHGYSPHGTVFRAGITIAEESPGVVRLDLLDRPAMRLSGVDAQVVLVLQQMAGTTEPSTSRLSVLQRRQLEAVLGRVGDYLAQACFGGGRQLVEVEAVARRVRYTPVPLAATDLVQLSRLALLRRWNDELAIEAPASGSRALLRHPGLGLLATGLTAPVRVSELVTSVGAQTGIPLAALRAVLELLVGAALADVGVAGPGRHTYASEDDEVLRQWELADLYFHSRSRLGRTDAPFGGQFPFRGQIEPQPTVKARPQGETVALPRPDFDAITAADPGLLQVMESRRSIRSYGSTPLTLDQLGEFLYRVGRVRGSFGPRPTAGMPYAATTRPYPCGGGAYEVELYLTIRRCGGLTAGSYFYDPAEHTLTLLPTSVPAQQELLDTASTSAGGKVIPDILITMTSRFQRVSWKYQAIAYAVTLKHVGVLYQTMYLVATAMGLAPCGLGSGNSESACNAFDLDYLEESSVGEFLLGSRPDLVDDSGAAASPVFDDWRPGLSPEWQMQATAQVWEQQNARTGRPTRS